MLSLDERMELLELMEGRELFKRENALNFYSAYAKQQEFHAAGLTFRERLLIDRKSVV